MLRAVGDLLGAMLGEVRQPVRRPPRKLTPTLATFRLSQRGMQTLLAGPVGVPGGYGRSLQRIPHLPARFADAASANLPFLSRDIRRGGAQS